MKQFISALLLTCVAGSVAAAENEIILTSQKFSGERSAVALDYMSSGDVAALQFAISLPKGSRNIDLSKCLVELPSSHTGICEANTKLGIVGVVIYNAANQPLPAGVVSIGTVSYVGDGQQGSAVPKLNQIEFARVSTGEVAAGRGVRDRIQAESDALHRQQGLRVR